MDLIFWFGFLLIFIVLVFLVRRYRLLYLKEKRRKASISIRHGKFLEHYIPWIKKIFPYNPERFRFIGNPIDGILFDKDKIVFIEFKTGRSTLNESQKKIKSLVKNKKIEWKEIRTE
ncbi:MAG: endonuclease [Candidatus Aenigmarchaeota archaeon]|nr:endonuclease [Candidatus Aenigmarchaeota archaeon]